MRALWQLFMGSVLILTLTLSAFAGEISTPLAPPQPASAPVTLEGQIEIGRNGDIHTGNSDEATAGDAVVAGALNLVQGVLSLL